MPFSWQTWLTTCRATGDCQSRRHYALPRYADLQQPADEPGAEQDTAAVLNALAHAGRPLTAEFLAESLCWDTDRVTDAIERAWAHPDLGGP
jgi:hypothetical protein